MSLAVMPSPSTTSTEKGGTQYLSSCGPQRMANNMSHSPACPWNTSAHPLNPSQAISPTSLQKPSNLSVTGRALMQKNLPNTRRPRDLRGWRQRRADGHPALKAGHPAQGAGHPVQKPDNQS